MEVFSSITADDIDLGSDPGHRTAVLKRFLTYAQHGFMDVAEPGVRDPDSDFEEAVGRSVSALGHKVVYQVGVAGFFVDLAVVDPENPGRYLLGIECDGASYHSSRSARDRDRLRQQVLEDRGWSIHRIWSTDWFKDPEGELRKVHQAILAAPRVHVGRDAAPDRESGNAARDNTEGGHPSTPAIEREDDEDESGLVDGTPYTEAKFSLADSREWHEIPLSERVEAVRRIVGIEAPIHAEEVARRVTQLRGQGRAGRRIREATFEAVRRLVRTDGYVSEHGFVRSAGHESQVRDRSEVSSPTLKKADMLPPSEVREAVRVFVTAHVGCTPDEAVVGVTRLFGFQRAGQDLKTVIEAQLRHMLGQDLLVLRGGNVYLAGA